jgi:uncharacterized damage-inducible protein DinB
VHGLSEEQARATPSVSTLCLGSLIKHVARTELRWMTVVVAGQPLPELWPIQDWESDFRLDQGETLASLLAQYDDVAAKTKLITSGVADPGQPVADPTSSWTVRWVLLHLIKETARHAGHADIIRESLDGSRAGKLAHWTEAAHLPALGDAGRVADEVLLVEGTVGCGTRPRPVTATSCSPPTRRAPHR